MAISHANYNLNNTSVQALNNHSIFEFSMSLAVQNTSASGFIFVGGQNVSVTSYGYRIDPGGTFTADVRSADVLYGIADRANTTCAVMYLE